MTATDELTPDELELILTGMLKVGNASEGDQEIVLRWVDDARRREVLLGMVLRDEIRMSVRNGEVVFSLPAD